jgi:hypothetical protein
MRAFRAALAQEQSSASQSSAERRNGSNSKAGRRKATRARHSQVPLPSRFGSSAQHDTAAFGISAHCIAQNRNAQQRGAAQGSAIQSNAASLFNSRLSESFWLKSKATHRVARHDSAPQSKHRQSNAWQVKATRSVHPVN